VVEAVLVAEAEEAEEVNFTFFTIYFIDLNLNI
jgi:hypothetical protein